MQIMGAPLVTIPQWDKYTKAQSCERFDSIVAEYYRQTWWGIRPDIMVSQFFKEVGVGGSFWGDRHNFCGLGVTGETSPTFRPEPGWAYDYKAKLFRKGWSFFDTASGVAAHYGHMNAHVIPDHAHGCDLYDPRHYVFNNVHPNDIVTVEEIGGKWNPNPKYGTLLVAFVTRIAAL